MNNLNDILAILSRNKKITIKRVSDNDIQIFMEVNDFPDILRIYPKTKSSEFLDIEDEDLELDELDAALEEKYYPEFPELKILKNYLDENKYDIIW